MIRLQHTADIASQHPALTAALAGLENAARSGGSLAEAIDGLYRAAIDAGVAIGPQTLLDRFPEMGSDREALDALVAGAIDSGEARGTPADSTLEDLCQARPDLESQVRISGMFRSMVRRAMSGSSPIQRGAAAPLPRPFGPLMPEGHARYELIERVGRGSQGEVYRAVDRVMSASGRTAWVALKLLPPLDPTAAHFSTLEASLAHRVRHGGVVSVLDRGSHQGQEYIVYEFVEGKAFDAWAAELPQRPRPRDATAMVITIADAVQAVHAAGVIHRDIQPRNILIDTAGRARITDFGLGMWAGDRRGVAVGATPAFAAPEQMTDRWQLQDGRVDVYALGGVLLWLVTGVAPGTVLLAGASEQEREEALEVVWAEAPGRDPTFRAIVGRALRARPADRYDSPAALREALRRWLDRLPVPGIDDSPGRRLALTLRRSPGLAAAMAGCVVLVGALGWVWGDRLVERERLVMGARIEAVTRAAATDRLDEARAVIRQYNDMLGGPQSHPQNLDMLPLYGPIEHLARLTGLSSDALDNMYGKRIHAVRALLNGTEQVPAAEGIARVVWQTALALWLTRVNDHEGARASIDDAMADAARWLHDDDPLYEDLRALRTIIAVRAMPDRTARDADALIALDSPTLARTLKRILRDEADAIRAGAAPARVGWFMPEPGENAGLVATPDEGQ